MWNPVDQVLAGFGISFAAHSVPLKCMYLGRRKDKIRNWGEITIIVSEVEPGSEGLGNFLNRALQESVIARTQ